VRIGDYEIDAEVAKGGMGAVYSALDPRLGRRVAIKVLLGRAGGTDDQRRRFQREAHALARLRHPNIVAIHDVGEERGTPFLVMDLIEGRSLQARLEAEGPLSSHEAARIALALASALEHAHAQGVLHRDLKPANVLLSSDGQVLLTDFGLAKDLDGSASRLSQSGALMGTPGFSPPEQVCSSPDGVGPAADVYGLGATLYCALTGRAPHEGASVLELIGATLKAVPERPSKIRPGVDRALEAICLRCLEKRVERRPASAAVLSQELERYLGGERRTSPALLPALLALAALLVVGLVWAVRAGGEGAQAPRVLDDQAPTLELSGPSSGSTTWDEAVTVTVVATDDDSGVELLVPGQERRAVRSGEPVRFEVPLREGQNLIRVLAVDPAGNETQASLEITRLAAPVWVARLPAARRPPLPLPEGLSFGSEPGEYHNAVDGSVLVYVPPGTFSMGFDDGSAWMANFEDRPTHRVTLSQGFFLGKVEVTCAQLVRCADEVPQLALVGQLAATALDLQTPAHSLSWDDARAYCAWAGLRLPTEAEWEFAARGVDGRIFPWGNDPRSPLQANGPGDRDGYESASPVGSFPEGASPWGALDMAGNVFEWVEDVFADYTEQAKLDPRGPRTGAMRVVRGGGYSRFPTLTRDPEVYLQTTTRCHYPPDFRDLRLGFRVCRSSR
jgi:eukaryotic-like serine/threonine-protein kinase